MHARPLRFAAALAIGAVTLVVATGCGGETRRPYRVGVITECAGILHTLSGAQLAAAELPLLEHGARLRDRDPARGVTPATVAGRPVEIVPGCTETLEFSTLTQEARRLIENEHVDALVAGSLGADEVVLRRLARAHSQVSVMAAATGPRELSGGRAPANFHRVVADESQGAAGLGTVARRDLGWRTAAVIYLDWDAGWGARDAFTAEFCSLGGRVTAAIPSADFSEGGALAQRIPQNVDGVVVFSAPPFESSRALIALARRLGNPRHRLLVGPGTTGDAASLRTVSRALDGVTGSSLLPVPSAPERRAYLRAYAKAFPALPGASADNAFVSGFNSSVVALLAALDRAGGRTADVPAQLTRMRLDLIGVPARLGAGGQADVPVHLVRIGRGGAAKLTPIRTVPAVDRSVGGLLPASLTPGAEPGGCRRTTPPPWSR